MSQREGIRAEMKDFPLQVEGPIGPWYVKVNAAVKRAHEAKTSEQLIEVLGDPDTIERVPRDDRRSSEEASEIWDYIDPYRPDFTIVLASPRGESWRDRG